ncbi:hypothetical protein B0F90DRAFT_1916760 [Multifurca ochricompacta]|uniref:Uncharacterized protein n=1 Tax=Multifurca ochricompacta TaxID=376703 RepID=A0AAD4M7X8_9AGAM|nr:hypothetical protein B0F90DRAFT_1916760 [Multifurca ochricompacta]
MPGSTRTHLIQLRQMPRHLLLSPLTSLDFASWSSLTLQRLPPPICQGVTLTRENGFFDARLISSPQSDASGSGEVSFHTYEASSRVFRCAGFCSDLLHCAGDDGNGKPLGNGLVRGTNPHLTYLETDDGNSDSLSARPQKSDKLNDNGALGKSAVYKDSKSAGHQDPHKSKRKTTGDGCGAGKLVTTTTHKIEERGRLETQFQIDGDGAQKIDPQGAENKKARGGGPGTCAITPSLTWKTEARRLFTKQHGIMIITQYHQYQYTSISPIRSWQLVEMKPPPWAWPIDK